MPCSSRFSPSLDTAATILRTYSSPGSYTRGFYETMAAFREIRPSCTAGNAYDRGYVRRPKAPIAIWLESEHQPILYRLYVRNLDILLFIGTRYSTSWRPFVRTTMTPSTTNRWRRSRQIETLFPPPPCTRTSGHGSTTVQYIVVQLGGALLMVLCHPDRGSTLVCCTWFTFSQVQRDLAIFITGSHNNRHPPTGCCAPSR